MGREKERKREREEDDDEGEWSTVDGEKVNQYTLNTPIQLAFCRIMMTIKLRIAAMPEVIAAGPGNKGARCRVIISLSFNYPFPTSRNGFFF